MILLGVATPARAGSQPPPIDTNPCTNGTLTMTKVDQWQKNGGGDLWQGVLVKNNGGTDIILNGLVRNVSPHFVSIDGANTWTHSKQGGEVAFSYTVLAGTSVILRVRVEEASDNDACRISAGCGTDVHLKTVGKLDRIEGNGK